MEAPYRKLFNLFAFSILALAVYINFLHKEEEPGSLKKTNSTYQQQATMVSKSKPVALENTKSLLSKEEKKN